NNYLKTTRYVQDTANRMLTGRVRSLSQEVDGVSNGATAAFVGTRELRAGAYPRPPLTLVVNRDGYQREPGDVIKYIDNVDNYVKVLRIAEVQKLATDETAEIVLNCVEDQYGVGAAAYSPFVPTGFHLTLHLSLELEDNLIGLTSDLLGVAGLDDGGEVLLSLAVFIPATASDSIDNLADSIALSLRTPQGLSLADSITLTDVVSVVRTPEILNQSLSDNVNNIADSVVSILGLAGFTFSDSINNLADSASTALASTINTPSDLASIWEYWEPSRNSFSDNDPIGTMAGQVVPGTGHNWTQSSAGAKPTYKASILNGLGIARFDGTDDELQGANPTALTAEHMFVVLKIDNDPPASGKNGNWSLGGGAVNQYPELAGTNPIWDGSFRTATLIFSKSSMNLAQWRVAEVVSTSSEYIFRLDGTVLQNGTGGTSFGHQSASSIRLGRCDPFNSLFLDGDIAGMYIFSAK